MSFYMESAIVEICMHFCYMQFSTIYSTAPIKAYLLHFPIDLLCCFYLKTMSCYLHSILTIGIYVHGEQFTHEFIVAAQIQLRCHLVVTSRQWLDNLMFILLLIQDSDIINHNLMSGVISCMMNKLKRGEKKLTFVKLLNAAGYKCIPFTIPCCIRIWLIDWGRGGCILEHQKNYHSGGGALLDKHSLPK